MAVSVSFPGFVGQSAFVARSLEHKFTVHDVATGAALAEAGMKLPSSAPVTACIVGQQLASRKRGRVDAPSDPAAATIVCGTAGGAVVASNTSAGASSETIASIPSSVSALCWAEDQRSVWVAGEGDKAVRRAVLQGEAVWNKVKLSSKSMGTVTCMTSVAGTEADGGLVMGGESLVFAAQGSSKPSVRLAGGHSAGVVALASSDVDTLVASADANRVLCMWSVTDMRKACTEKRDGKGKATARIAPLATKALVATPQRLRLTPLRSADGMQCLVASGAGGVQVLLLSATGSIEASAWFDAESIQTGAEVLDACARIGPAGPEIAAVVGAAVAPRLVSSPLLDSATGALRTVWGAAPKPAPATAASASASASSSSASSAAAGPGPSSSAVSRLVAARGTVAPSHPAGLAGLALAEDDDDEEEEQDMQAAMDAAAVRGSKRSKRRAAGDDEEDDDEDEDDRDLTGSAGASMAARLRALTGVLQSTPLPSGTASSSGGDDAGSSGRTTGGARHSASSASSTSGSVVSAASLEGDRSDPASMATVLSQALHANDSAQLEMVLSSTDPEAVDATVARLEAKFVVQLLRQVVSRFEAKPARGASMARWLRAVMVHHAAALASTPGLVSQLAGVYHIVDARLAAYRKLLRLAGRLDLLLGQLGAGGASAAALSGTVDESGATEITIT